MACTWSVYQGLNEVRGGGAFIISRHYHYYQLSLIVITMGRAAGSGAKRARALSFHSDVNAHLAREPRDYHLRTLACNKGIHHAVLRPNLCLSCTDATAQHRPTLASTIKFCLSTTFLLLINLTGVLDSRS